jgi:hypothetical protein
MQLLADPHGERLPTVGPAIHAAGGNGLREWVGGRRRRLEPHPGNGPRPLTCRKHLRGCLEAELAGGERRIGDDRSQRDPGTHRPEVVQRFCPIGEEENAKVFSIPLEAPGLAIVARRRLQGSLDDG